MQNDPNRTAIVSDRSSVSYGACNSPRFIEHEPEEDASLSLREENSLLRSELQDLKQLLE